MSFVNLYKPPPVVGPTYGPDPYDINSIFPIHLSSLENDRLKLTPFIPRKHAQCYFDQSHTHDRELYRWMPITFPTLDSFLSMVENWFRLDPTWVLFAIIDKTKSEGDPGYLVSEGGSLAGMIGLIHSSDSNLVTEIGAVVVLPPFQHTHVTPNAVGLLMQYCLSLPTAPKPGLGLRRVEWTTNPANIPSNKVAENMGMKKDGYLRWIWVLPEGKEGREGRKGEKPGRDSVLYAVCWDDWEGGVREQVQKLMDRA